MDAIAAGLCRPQRSTATIFRVTFRQTTGVAAQHKLFIKIITNDSSTVEVNMSTLL